MSFKVMNVLLLGNGFDLYHNLPTDYSDFLHTANFLINSYSDDMDVIGSILGNKGLHEKSKHIKICYDTYQSSYDSIPIEKEKIIEICDLLQKNPWFHYLTGSFNKVIGWIDFEKEISTVIHSFNDFLKLEKTELNIMKLSALNRHILFKFNYFLGKVGENTSPLSGHSSHRVKPEYLTEYPYGSKRFILNKEKIIDELSNELFKFSNALRLYLSCFVENTLSSIKHHKNFKKCPAIEHIDNVVSFNYTNTFEEIYSDIEVFHLHGNINNSIVLGVNPDESDDGETVDVSFISFKKYFQRTMYESDVAYIKWLRGLESEINLLIMGHSLDITDKDIIQELFYEANKITILFHNLNSKASYIANLIKIFGKEEFDDIRKEKQLTFLFLDSDFTDFLKQQYELSDEGQLKKTDAFLTSSW